MSTHKHVRGHLAAFLTIILWGTTFISTKVLLNDFTPVEILFFRFTIGYLTLLLIYPHVLTVKDKKQECLFAGAGLCGVTLYFLLENIALTYSFASNIGVIISIAPFFTAIFAHFLIKEERLRVNFFIGFIVAITGIFLISFNGSVVLKLNPLGDILAVFAAIVWAMYSILTKKISEFGYQLIQSTRRCFMYGLLFMLPTLAFFDFSLGLDRFAQPVLLLNVLYLGLGASAICFVSWGYALKLLGAVKTSVYIYIVPVVTIITSVIILDEKVTGVAIVGTCLTLLGLFLSEYKFKRK